MNKVYEGGIPTHGFETNDGTVGYESLSQPDCVCAMDKPKTMSQGSVDSTGYTGKDVNPPADGEVTIATRKDGDNQPV